MDLLRDPVLDPLQCVLGSLSRSICVSSSGEFMGSINPWRVFRCRYLLAYLRSAQHCARFYYLSATNPADPTADVAFQADSPSKYYLLDGWIVSTSVSIQIYNSKLTCHSSTCIVSILRLAVVQGEEHSKDGQRTSTFVRSVHAKLN